MTTLAARDEYSVAIAAGEILTITSSVSSTGYVDRWRGSTNLGRTDITASQSLVFGPYLFGMRFNVVCQTGNISFTSSDENSAIDDITDVLRFGAVGDGVTDDAAALQGAIDHAASLLIGESYINVDLCGKTYGVGSGFIVKAGVVLSNGALLSVGSSWAITDPMVTISNSEHAGLYRVLVDCQWKCAGVLRNSGYRSSIDKCTVQRFKTYGVKDTGTTQEATLTNSVIRQFDYGDTGFDTAANRDAPCLWVDTADSQYSNLVLNYGSIPLYVTGPLNQFNIIHAYNGAATGGGEIAAIQIEGADASNNQFTNIYADNGVIKIIDNFKQSFTTVKFQRTGAGTNNNGFELTTSTADTDGSGFSATDVLYNGNFTNDIAYLTTGAGTWKGAKKVNLLAFRNSDGTNDSNIAQFSDAAAFDSSGRFLVGYPFSSQIGSNQSSVQLKGATTATASASTLNYGNTADGAGQIFGKSRGGFVGTYSGVLSGDILGYSKYVGDDGTSGHYNAVGANIQVLAEVNWSNTDRSSSIVFQTTSGTTVADKVVINSSGDMNIALGTLKIAGTKVLGAQETGWTAATGTPNKAAYATYAGQTVSAAYVQAEAQATDDAAKANSQRIKALEDAMRTHGLIN